MKKLIIILVGKNKDFKGITERKHVDLQALKDSKELETFNKWRLD